MVVTGRDYPPVGQTGITPTLTRWRRPPPRRAQL